MTKKALEGVVVLDLTNVLSGRSRRSTSPSSAPR